MIYGFPSTHEPVDQGDIFDHCPLTWIERFDPQDPGRLETIHTFERVIVLTQTCDLLNRKAGAVVIAMTRDAQQLVDNNILRSSDIKGPIRGGRVFGWYFLPEHADSKLPEMIVDLRQIHTLPGSILSSLSQQGRRRARLLPLYREHMAKHFADTYSRIGLPEPYETI